MFRIFVRFADLSTEKRAFFALNPFFGRKLLFCFSCEQPTYPQFFIFVCGKPLVIHFWAKNGG